MDVASHVHPKPARVSAVAVHRAVWGELHFVWATEGDEVEPDLFEDCRPISDDLPF